MLRRRPPLLYAALLALVPRARPWTAPSQMRARFNVARKSLFSSLQADAETLGRGRLIAAFDADDFAPSWPYSEQDLLKGDPTDDAFFYMQPRYVTHIDDEAIAALTDFYQTVLRQEKARGVELPRVLDMCSSWISHLPQGEALGRTVGVGMNPQELARNEQLTEYTVQNLNDNPKLELEDGTFDVVVNCVSVDYLTRPLEIFQEVHRVLAPGGVAIFSFSNRCFPTKVVNMWLQNDDIGRLAIVGSYFHFASADWEFIKAFDLQPGTPGQEGAASQPGFLRSFANAFGVKVGPGDPMYAVVARKKKASAE